MPWIQTYTPVSSSSGPFSPDRLNTTDRDLCLSGRSEDEGPQGRTAVSCNRYCHSGLRLGMPFDISLWSFVQGAGFGLFPVFYIVLTTLFLL
jgi:lactate permease